MRNLRRQPIANPIPTTRFADIGSQDADESRNFPKSSVKNCFRPWWFCDFSRNWMGMARGLLGPSIVDLESHLVGLSPILILMITIFIALGAVAFSMATSVFKHWKLSLWLQGSLTKKTMALHLTQGLLKRQSIQIPLHKIQWVMWENTLIRRMFWMNTIHIRQSAAGGGSESTSASELDKNSSLHMSIPAMDSERTRSLERHSFSNLARTKIVDPPPSAICLLDSMVPTRNDLEPSIVTSRMDVGMGDFCDFRKHPMELDWLGVLESVSGSMGHDRWALPQRTSWLVVQKSHHD